jgi:hypothetical protein
MTSFKSNKNLQRLIAFVSLMSVSPGILLAANRPPNAPQLISPNNNTADNDAKSISLRWNSVSDPDGDAVESFLAIRERGQAWGDPLLPGGLGKDTSYSPTTLRANTSYEWMVAAVDRGQHSNPWYTWSEMRTFTTTGANSQLTKGDITSPQNGSQLTSTSVTFRWNPGLGISHYWLFVGTSLGAYDILEASQGVSLSGTVHNLPRNGAKLYVRLHSWTGSTWLYSDYTYTALLTSNPSQPAQDSINAWNYSAGRWEQFSANGVVWITSEPSMPWLAVQHFTTGLSKPLNTLWQFKSQYPGHQTRSIDSRAFPAASEFIGIPYGQFWYATRDYFGRQFFGGDAVFNFSDSLSESPRSFTFKIRGRNPTPAAARSYVSAVGAPRYATAIFQHESYLPKYATIYNQFYPTGESEGEPVWGYPDGWGLAQIDRTSEKTTASTTEVWNWQANLSGGLGVLEEKRKAALAYFEYIKRTYPTKWEEPPATYQDSRTKTPLTYLEAAVITLYNGASVQEPKNAPVYNSCWRFTPSNPSGKRWEFVPNSHDYVFLIVQVMESGG